MKKLVCVLLTCLLVLSMSAAFAEANTELSGTVRIIGPGQLNDPGAEGTEDLITGIFKPGYNKLFEMFNEDYPNIKIEFTESPWDNWIAVLQTAAAGGTADILLHGSMLTDISMDLTPFLEASPEFLDALATGPEYYRDPEDYTKTIPTGISYVVDPYFALIDTKLFEDWGVELPTADWTWEDLLDIASKLTGTNPVTGEQNYGVYNFNMDGNSSWKAWSSYGAAKGFVTHTYETPNKFEAILTYDSEESIAAFEYFNELAKYSPPSFAEGMGNEKKGRADSDIAIYLTESLAANYATTLADDVADRFMYLPLPVNEDQSDAKYSSFTGTNSIALAKNAAEPELAWTFIKWLIMDEDAQQWLVDNFICPSTKYGVQLLRDKGYPFVDAFDMIMSDFWDVYTISQTAVVDVAYGNELSLFYSEISEMYAGSITPEECAKAIQEGLLEYQEMNK